MFNNSNVSPSEILKQLYKKKPMFHGREKAGKFNYAISSEVLQWIINNIPENSNTLETGCGYSTVVLSSLSKNHIVISPFPQEHTLIDKWCNGNGITTKHVNMISKISQDVVPELNCAPLDFILIDGDHAFPAPFIDWYYTADKLKVGGYLAVDDTQIPTGKILRNFLLKETSRWTSVTQIGNTAIFKRIGYGQAARNILFIDQPYCQIQKKSLMTRIFNKIKRSVIVKK